MGAKRQIWWWVSAAGGLVAGLALPPVGLPPLLWLVSSRADAINGMRYDANAWDVNIDADAAAQACGIEAGFVLKG